MRRAARMTLKFSIAVVWQLSALKGSAGAQFYLFGHTVVFQPSISCALRLQVRLSWILGVFLFLTYFVRHRPNEISKVANLMKFVFGCAFVTLDEGCLRKSNYIFRRIWSTQFMWPRNNRSYSTKPEGPKPIIPNCTVTQNLEPVLFSTISPYILLLTCHTLF